MVGRLGFTPDAFQLQAFDALDGIKLWQMQRPGDPLTLAQTGVIAAFKDTLVVGQGPRMAGLDPLNGSVRWEVPIGSPRARRRRSSARSTR